MKWSLSIFLVCFLSFTPCQGQSVLKILKELLKDPSLIEKRGYLTKSEQKILKKASEEVISKPFESMLEDFLKKRFSENSKNSLEKELQEIKLGIDVYSSDLESFKKVLHELIKLTSRNNLNNEKEKVNVKVTQILGDTVSKFDTFKWRVKWNLEKLERNSNENQSKQKIKELKEKLKHAENVLQKPIEQLLSNLR